MQKLQVVDILYDLSSDNFISEIDRGRYRYNDWGTTAVGTFMRRQNGKNSFIPEDGGTPIFVAERNSAHALNGDKVKIQLHAKRKGADPEGEVIEILESQRRLITGKLQVTKGFAFLITEDKTLANDIFIPKDKLKGGKTGDKAIVRITEWPEEAKNPLGEVVDILGTAGDNNAEMNAILAEFDLPYKYPANVEKAAEKIKKDSDVLIVIGIGGSYLGARAAIEFLRHGFYNSLPKEKRGTPEIYYVGNSISSTYLQGVIDVIGDRDFSVNVISKSGTTTEPAIAFRIFKKMLEDKYGQEEAAKRIYATTDKARGALKDLATKEGYESFVVPDDVGGRFSVLTAVGLLPIAVSGADIKALMDGAESGRELALNEKFEDNEAMKYAAIRNILLRKGKSVEVLANYEPALHYIGEWWKQLYGESEGKDQKGIFPAAVDLTTDLHSMGQFIQDGSRTMFETVINIEKSRTSVVIDEDPEDLDGLNYLAGKDMDFLNKSAMNGTILAHTDGNVPNLMVRVPEQNEFYLGELFYMYEFACGVSGYILGVNPFNQPGVESYKKNMFALLGKPGYEDMTEALLKRL